MRVNVKDSKKATKIKNTNTAKKIDHLTFFNAIAASSSSELNAEHLDPATFTSVLQSAVKSIQSKGGRPGRVEETLRKKIPLTEIEWQNLEVVTHTFQQLGVSISTGQVASLLINDSLQKLLPTIEAVNNEMTKLQAAAKADSNPQELLPISDILQKKIFLKKIKQAVPSFHWDAGEPFEKK
jgi:ribonuclease HII